MVDFTRSVVNMMKTLTDWSASRYFKKHGGIQVCAQIFQESVELIGSHIATRTRDYVNLRVAATRRIAALQSGRNMAHAQSLELLSPEWTLGAQRSSKKRRQRQVQRLDKILALCCDETSFKGLKGVRGGSVLFGIDGTTRKDLKIGSSIGSG